MCGAAEQTHQKDNSVNLKINENLTTKKVEVGTTTKRQAMVIFQLQRHFRKVPLKQKWNASLHVEIFRKDTTPAPLEGVVFDQLVRSNLKLPLQPHDPTTRWQRDRKKQQQQQLGLEGNTKTLHVPHTFFTFLYRFCTSTTRNFLILHFMEDVNK